MKEPNQLAQQRRIIAQPLECRVGIEEMRFHVWHLEHEGRLTVGLRQLTCGLEAFHQALDDFNRSFEV